MSQSTLAYLRTGSFLLFGLLVLLYALGTLALGDQIFSGWVLLWAGLLMNAILFLSYKISNAKTVQVIWDEHSTALFNRAVFCGYFATVVAIPILALGLEAGMVSIGVAFSALIGVTIGVPMVLFALFEIRANQS